MQASYFGSRDQQLLGLYHPPAGPRPRDVAVLLCYPAPQEYMRVHWAFRKLTMLLSREGFHVFRFDYFGTGDSAGEGHQGTLEQWRADIESALAELKDISGTRKASLVGFRLGATLAAQAAIKVRDLVLWEPVVDGAAYLEEMRHLHLRRYAHCLHPPELPAGGPLGELLGHSLPPAVEEPTRALALAPPLACRAERIALVTSEHRPEYERVARELEQAATEAGTAFARRQVEEDGASGDEPFLLSTRAQQAIASLLAGGSA